MKWIAGFILAIMVPAIPLSAGEADVVQVSVTTADIGIYRFDVTVQHGDTGWILSGVKIPDNIQQVSVRAHDSLHAYGGRVMTYDLSLK